MEPYKIKKVENCFKDSQTYEYLMVITLHITDIEGFARGDNLDIKTNFRRPFFIITRENGVKIKGILNSNRIKVSFPDHTWKDLKTDFEEELIRFLQYKESK